MAWGLIDLLSDRMYVSADGLSPYERSRLRGMAYRLKASNNPVPLLRAWLPLRAQRMELSCAVSVLDDLAHDARVVRSGISDQRSGMPVAAKLEFYVVSADRSGLLADYLLAPSTRPNVYVHVSHRPMPKLPPLVILAADLADHNEAREDIQARQLLQAALWA